MAITTKLKGRAVGLDVNMAATAAQVDIKWANPPSASSFRSGLLVRVKDNKNFLMVAIASAASFAPHTFISVINRNEGKTEFTTERFSVELPWIPTFWTSLVVLVSGQQYSVWAGPKGGLLRPYMGGEFSATPMPAEGDVYLYDENSTASESLVREYDNLTAWALEASDGIPAAGEFIEVRSDGIYRTAGGNNWGRITPRSGQNLYAPPSYLEARPARGIIIPSRGDLATLPDNELNKLKHQALYYPGYHFAAEAGASSYYDLFIAGLKSIGMEYILAPETAVGGLTNQGTLAGGVPAATLGGGIVQTVADSILPGGASWQCDGINDQVFLNWLTRTNLLLQPSPEVSNTQWTSAGGFFTNASTVTRDTATTQFDGVACLKCVTTGALEVEGFQAAFPVVTGKTYTVSAMVKGAVGGEKVQICIGSAAVGNAVSGTSVLGSVNWGRITVTFTATGTGTAVLAIRTPLEKKAQTFYADCFLAEQSETMGTFFPLVSELTSGLCGWSGTAWESNADQGPFARGTKRTFVVNLRKNGSGTYGVVGQGNNGLYIGGSALVLRMGGEGAADYSWAGVIPTNEKRQIIVTVDDINNEAELYIDGKFQFNTAPTKPFLPTTENASLGAAFGAAFSGDIGPLAISTRRLTRAEVEKLAF